MRAGRAHQRSDSLRNVQGRPSKIGPHRNRRRAAPEKYLSQRESDVRSCRQARDHACAQAGALQAIKPRDISTELEISAGWGASPVPRRNIERISSHALLSIIAFAAVLATQAAAAQSQFSIAGVHVGEKPADVLSRLRSEGYGVVKVSRSDSFRQRLSDARNAELRQPHDRVRTTDVGTIVATHYDQRIRVNFDDDATGSRIVSSIHYDASSVAHPFNRVRATMVRRYGRPRAEDGTGPVWCTNDTPDVCLAHGVRGDRLKVGHDYRGFDPAAELTTIELVAGNDLVGSWEEGFRAALAQVLKSRDAF
jgi:hypothetical protein